MELYFLALLIVLMAAALGSGFPVAFALPGAAIVSVAIAAIAGYLFAGSTDAYFHTGSPSQWMTAGVTNLRGVYWVVERDTLIAIPLFIFMGIMLQKSKIAEDLLVTMAQLFGPVPGGLGISVVFVGALLAATTGIVGATVVAMGLISLPAMLRNNYSKPLATGTIAASGTLGQIIPPSIVLIILADQLASASDQASTARKALYKATTGELSMPSVFDVASTSAGEMFLGAFVPGLVLVLLYMVFILIYALIRPSAAPAVHYDGKRNLRFWGRVLLILVPPLALIFLVLGSIIAGIATVNQAGAIGAAGALIMAGYRLTEGKRGAFLPAIIAFVGLVLIAVALKNYDMNVKAVLSNGGDMTGIWLGAVGVLAVLLALIWSAGRTLRIGNTMYEVMIETAKTTSLVFIILLGAAMLTASFRAFGGEDLVRDFLNALPGGFWTQFIIVMAVIFILGFFLDFIEIAVVVVPIVAPILLADPAANVTAVWLGVMIGLNIQTSFLTPPFGFALFYLRGVAPASVKTIEIYRGVVAFIFLQLTALAIVGYYPQLVNYLPNRVSFLSETSPPPRNPKLQICLEQYIRDNLAENGDDVRAAIAAAQALDISYLPKSVARGLEDAFKSADAAIGQLDEVFAANEAVDAAAGDFRPQLNAVRDLQKSIRDLNARADALRKDSRFLTGDENAEKLARYEAQIAELDAQAKTLEAQIPDSWDGAYKDFHDLLKARDKARLAFRRSADNSVDAAREFIAVLDAGEDFAALEATLADLRGVIETATPEEAEAALKAAGRAVNAVAGARDVASQLSKARRAIKPGKEDREKAMAAYEKALAAYAEQKAWRARAEQELRPGIEAYLDGIRETIGARQQPRLSRAQALYIAACDAGHRNLSLNF